MTHQISAPVRTLVVLCCLGALNGAAWSAPAGIGRTDPSPDELLATGNEAFENGRFESALSDWDEASRLYAAAQDVKGRIDALTNLAAAQQMLGHFDLAIEQLWTALALATERDDKARMLRVHEGLGVAETMKVRDPGMEERADGHLEQALQLARQLEDRKAEARIHGNLGNFLAVIGRHQEAVESYERCLDLAQEIEDGALTARALSNAAIAALDTADFTEAGQFNGRAVAAIASLADTHDKAFLLITAGLTDKRLMEHRPAPDRPSLLRRACDSLVAAKDIARSIGDKRSQSYALGHLGSLYELEERYDEAIQCTLQASFMAQQVRSNDALYRWQWQHGRLLRGKGDPERALSAYQRAVDTLETIRKDVVIGHGNRSVHYSFRNDVGSLYLELADLLLQMADGMGDADETQRYLRRARDTAELLKSAELTDYFQDTCVELMRRDIDDFEDDVAVVYLIPLADRTEILLNLGSKKLERVDPLAVPAVELMKEVDRFRKGIKDTSEPKRFQQSGQKLYEWLIAPIEKKLQSVDTLVFVPDGKLRTIPMAALYDGRQFLIEKYAVAVTPGLRLMEGKTIRRENVRVLLNGLSVRVDHAPGFRPLANVPEELDDIERLFSATKLMNEDFQVDRVQEEVRREQYGIVHIASHGQFSRNLADTFVLAYDSRLTLDRLEDLIRPSRFRGEPVELLTLSACQTAAGDDRAALGLAGIAIKAGARSALASLWSVDDKSTAQLIMEFYNQLSHSDQISKAEALRRAQRMMLQHERRRFRHPYYWAPFLIIGNWS